MEVPILPSFHTHSPFPFLQSAPSTTVEIVHNVILADHYEISRREEMVKLALDDANKQLLLAYCQDLIDKLAKTPPKEAVNELDMYKQAFLQQKVNDKNFKELEVLKEDWSPTSRKLMDKWYGIMTNEAAAIGYAFSELQRKLVLFLEEKKSTEKSLEQSRETSIETIKYQPVSAEVQDEGQCVRNSARTERNYTTSTEKPISVNQTGHKNGLDNVSQQHEVVHTGMSTTPLQNGFRDIPVVHMKERTLGRTVTPLSPSPHPLSPKLKPKVKSIPPLDQDLETGDVSPENIYNILLLGETGVGKTTFINSCANYVQHATMHDALKAGPVILTNVSFTTSVDLKSKLVKVSSNCEKQKKNVKNEDHESSEKSCTQEPLIHTLHWTKDGEKMLLRIIDTPGANDTRGEQQDEDNFQMVLNLIGKIGKLHAICVLLKPNQSRLTLGFRRSLDFFLIRLHTTATKNILFCFTNTRSTGYRPGDTMPVLKKYFEDLQKSRAVLITPNSSNVFCFDNESFRYMCLLMSDSNNINSLYHDTLASSWAHNVRMLQSFLERVKCMQPHIVDDTLSLQKVNNLLVSLARPLLEIVQNLMINKAETSRKIKEIENHSTRGQVLQNAIFTQTTVIRMRLLDHPRTVCSNYKCSDQVKLSDGRTQLKPKRICHDNCTLKGKQNQCVNNEFLKHCAAFRDTHYRYTSVYSALCQVCNCHWTDHMHIAYELVPETETMFDDNARAEYQKCNDDKTKAKVVKQKLEEELAVFEDEYTSIKENCAAFSAYLKYNSIKGGTDPYLDYLNHLVKVEKEKCSYAKSPKKMYDELVNIVDCHQTMVNHIVEEVKQGRRTRLTYAEITTLVQHMSRFKFSGELIRDIAGEMQTQNNSEAQI